VNITLIGNCQTKTLTWYLQQINPDFNVKWVFPDWLGPNHGQNWANPGSFIGKSIPTVLGVKDFTKRLKTSSFVIYQHLSPALSENLNWKKITSYNPKCNFISISSFVYNPKDATKRELKGMIDRANKFNIDIPAHKIIEKHGSKITIDGCKNHAHPHVFYFLELVREICAKTGWDYYSEEQYNQYLKEGYPFG